MKKLVLFLLSVGMFLGTSVGSVKAKALRTVKRETYGIYLIKRLPKQPLSEKEVKWLIKMREEEKLARDVYLSIFKKYHFRAFRNIAKSERYHMRLIGVLLRKYDLEDPIKGIVNEVGEFKSPEFKKLYDSLLKRADLSLIDALKVGAEIEELDIKDLKAALKDTDNRDVRIVYENLMKASRNHLRAFVRILKRYGVKYEPKYLSQEEVKKILSVKHEAGFYNAKGKPYVLSTKLEVKGKIVDIKKVAGIGKRRITWWAIDVKTKDGKVYEVRLIPTMVYRTLSGVEKGKEVEVLGYQPPYWIVKGINAVMACKVKESNGKTIYDFSFRRICKRLEASQ